MTSCLSFSLPPFYLRIFPNWGKKYKQWNAAALARLRKTAQGNGTITITAEGDRPTIDIPITVVLTGMERLDDLEDRMDYLEDAVQGDGGYVSKYSGEEIDTLLDKVFKL